MRTSQGLLLCGLFLAFILPSGPAYASEKRVMGDVVVDQYQTVDDISTAWGDVLVEGEVNGDVRSGFGDIEVNGPVGGDVDAGSGDVWINAPVGGDVDVGSGDLYLEPGAAVSGGISRGSGNLYRQPDAAVGGAERAGMASGFEDYKGPLEALSHVIGWAVGTLALVAAAVLLAVVAPRPLRASARSLEASLGRSLVLGLGSVPAAVVASILLFVTGVGILLLFLLWPAYFALLFFGLLVAAYFLGRKVVLFTGRYRSGEALAAAVGAILVSMVFLIPFLGSLFVVVLALLGTGAAVSALFTRWRPSHAPRTAYASYEDYLRERGGG